MEYYIINMAKESNMFGRTSNDKNKQMKFINKTS